MSDSLTGLLSRDELAAEGARLAETSTLLSAVLVDIDDAKGNNHILSHAVGDALITEIARRISSVMGPHGLVGRYSGDEFVALLPGMATEEVVALAEKVRDLVAATPVTSVSESYLVSAEETSQLEGYGHFYGPLEDGTYAVATKHTRVEGYPRVAVPSPGLPVTAAFASVTIGVATAARADIQSLLRASDEAMYQGKEARDGAIRSALVWPDS